ncbi:ribosomal biogenesis factor isoform X2 [Bacillus rossius redtenbacheri]|uniref:ribosomal biogenesis factor isoform X2 n=1 Tax=Bacillus rossius redtenbacheri TaxID=93214 RepID=UPI002FDCB8C6
MGKNKGGNKHKPVKNVFKVAGAKSLKIKNKAKAVSGQLKKLNEVTRKKTAEVDGQLAALRDELLQQTRPVMKKTDVPAAKREDPVTCPDPAETADKLCQMKM